MSDQTVEQAAHVIHGALCYDSWEECRAEYGKCMNAADSLVGMGWQPPTVRDQITAMLDKHRGSSTRNFVTGEYKNRARHGYDRALTEVLALLGVDATEVRADV